MKFNIFLALPAVISATVCAKEPNRSIAILFYRSRTKSNLDCHMPRP
jgi:hypothetical protein